MSLFVCTNNTFRPDQGATESRFRPVVCYVPGRKDCLVTSRDFFFYFFSYSSRIYGPTTSDFHHRLWKRSTVDWVVIAPSDSDLDSAVMIFFYQWSSLCTCSEKNPFKKSSIRTAGIHIVLDLDLRYFSTTSSPHLIWFKIQWISHPLECLLRALLKLWLRFVWIVSPLSSKIPDDLHSAVCVSTGYSVFLSVGEYPLTASLAGL